MASREFGLRQLLATYALLVDAVCWLVGDLLLDKDLLWDDQGFFPLVLTLVLLPLVVAIPAGIPVYWVGSFVPREVKEGWRQWTGRISGDLGLPESALNELTPLVFTAVIGGIGAAVMV